MEWLKDKFEKIFEKLIIFFFVITIISCSVLGGIYGYSIGDIIGLIIGLIAGFACGFFGGILIYGFYATIIFISNKCEVIEEELYNLNLVQKEHSNVSNTNNNNNYNKDTIEPLENPTSWVCLKCGELNPIGTTVCKKCGHC